MERKRIRAVAGLRHLVLAAALVTGTACATTLDAARVAYDNEEYEDAEDLYKEAMNDPKTEELAKEELVELYLERAHSYEKDKIHAKSEKYFGKVLDMQSDNVDALEGRARALRALYRFDEALTLAVQGVELGCRGCKRLVAVMLIARADAYMQNGQWAEAESDYLEAAKTLPDVAVSLGIVRARVARKDVDAAAKGLAEVVVHIGQNDLDARNQYLELRRGVVLLALEQDKVPLADEVMDLTPAGVGGAAQIGLAIEVSMELRKKGEPEKALERMTALVEAAQAGRIQVSEERKAELQYRVATLYAARASVSLTNGFPEEADRDLDTALKMRPGEPAFLLQKVLITAGRGNLTKAAGELRKINKKTDGYKKVDAILVAMEVDAAIAGGRIADAKIKLDKAKQMGPDLPEVHIATAQWLAQTPVSGLSKQQLAELKKNGVVSYPGGTVTRVGEAMSELDWSRQQIRGLGAAYPHRAPGTTRRIDALEQKIRKFFPHKVKFQGDPTALLVVRNPGSAALEVKVEGGGVASGATIGAGESKKIKVPEPGFLRLKYRGTTATLVTEPYTELEISL